MLCELCGRETPFTKQTEIEGSVLKVCPDCAKFGTPVESRSQGRPSRQGGSTKKEGGGKSPGINVSERLERRARRHRERDVFDREEEELAADFSKRIRRGRVKRDWSQEDLAKKLNEKKSIIAKLESNSMYPDDKLRKKLERTLDVKLTEHIEPTKTTSHESGRAMTLGDYFRKAK